MYSLGSRPYALSSNFGHLVLCVQIMKNDNHFHQIQLYIGIGNGFMFYTLQWTRVSFTINNKPFLKDQYDVNGSINIFQRLRLNITQHEALVL